DLIKEATIAIGVMVGLAVVLTILFSSPDDKPTTVQQWARSTPADFVTTAVTELDGSSGTGGYGPPYNHNADGQHIAFLYPQKWLGVSHPIDTAADYVINPLREINGEPVTQAAVSAYLAAPAKLQTAWTDAYTKALANATPTAGGSALTVKPGNYGPVPIMMNSLLQYAQGGGLDGALVNSTQFYQTDYTKPLLFMADGGVLSDRAQTQHLLGEQWGMMNETGSFPGQTWLWLYTLWYQIKPFSTSDNADILVMAVMGVLSLAFILIPLIPGIRDIPRRIPLYKLIWRDYYRGLADPPKAGA
ncbi:MAG TPA: hypothetical protein VII87_06040, partial [Solirubrobacteraceae bacterium]